MFDPEMNVEKIDKENTWNLVLTIVLFLFFLILPIGCGLTIFLMKIISSIGI